MAGGSPAFYSFKQFKNTFYEKQWYIPDCFITDTVVLY